MNGVEAKICDEVAVAVFARLMDSALNHPASGEVPTMNRLSTLMADSAFIAAQEFILARRRASKAFSEASTKGEM